jgi:hypothetical protein
VLLSLQEAAKGVEGDRHLAIVGDEALLSELPKGSWIGGTTPYFQAEGGCTVTIANSLWIGVTDPQSISMNNNAKMSRGGARSAYNGFSGVRLWCCIGSVRDQRRLTQFLRCRIRSWAAL